ncbi:MAG: hypothetical protein MUC98_02930 [Desulfobacterota bacterium]|nr:hypothetical protein [Thermodesulfobacteriota bacterium]
MLPDERTSSELEILVHITAPRVLRSYGTELARRTTSQLYDTLKAANGRGIYLWPQTCEDGDDPAHVVMTYKARINVEVLKSLQALGHKENPETVLQQMLEEQGQILARIIATTSRTEILNA